MVIDVDSTTDNIVSFCPICRTLTDRKLDYSEPRPSSAHLTKNPLSLESVDALILTQPPTKYPIPAPLKIYPSKHPSPSPSTAPTKVNPVSPSDIAKMYLHDIPDIRPFGTASPLDTRQTFDPLKLHQIFCCRRSRNPKHITFTADNATFIDTSEPPTTLGAFTTTPKANKGKSNPPRCHFLDKFHMYVVYGDCPSMGGSRYGFLLADAANRYC